VLYFPNAVLLGNKSTLFRLMSPTQCILNNHYRNVLCTSEAISFYCLAPAGAGIQPETAPTTDCGKGLVKDAVFTEVKRAICRVDA